MNKRTAFRITQGVYYLSLGTWFGAMVMLVLTAITVFATVRQFDVSIHAGPYGQGMWEDRATAILAGGIVGNVLRALAVVQVICAASAVACAALQSSVFACRLAGGRRGKANLLRLALLFVPIVILAADQAVVTPRIWQTRQVMYDSEQPEQVRQQAQARFDRLHTASERMGGLATLALAGAILVSPFAWRDPAQMQQGEQANG